MKTLFTLVFLSISSLGFAQDNLPSMRLDNLQGRPVSTQDISKDQLVVISLWATWCVPCLKELEAIDNVYAEWQKETGVQLYAISVDDARTAKRVRPLVNGKSWDYNILLDPNNEFKRAVGAASIPMTLVVKNNKILYRHSGYSPGAEDELYKKLQEFSK